MHIPGMAMKIIPYYFRLVQAILFNFLTSSTCNGLTSPFKFSDRNAGKGARKRGMINQEIRRLLIAVELDSLAE